MTHLSIDFETRSPVELKKSGVHVYATHKDTDAWCMSYAFDEETPEIWVNWPLLNPDDVLNHFAEASSTRPPLPQRIIDHIAAGGEVHGHNVGFEWHIWNLICVPRYGWPALPIEQCHCTAAMAAAMSMPRSLEDVAIALRLQEQKDKAGSRVMMQLAKPRRVEADGTLVWWTDSGKHSVLHSYCKQDVVVEREVEKRLRPLSPMERKVWLLDFKINQRGVRVDLPLVKAAQRVVRRATERLNFQMGKVTDGQVTACTQAGALTEWLGTQGVATDSVAKDQLLELLDRRDLPAKARQALLLRQEAAKASTAKLTAMQNSVSSDGRVRGMFLYCAAGTGRWGGLRVQLQNLPRGTVDFDWQQQLIPSIYRGDLDTLGLICNSPMQAVSDLIRLMLIPNPGNEFLVADFSAIEARGLAFLAGEEKVLETFREGKDIYLVAASGIFGREITKKDKDPRQVGKVSVLALGYQGGVGAFQSMAKIYNVKMDPVFPILWERASQEDRDKAKHAYETRGKAKTAGKITEEAWLASELTKIAWRRDNPNIVQFWKDLENAAVGAVANPGTVTSAGKFIKFRKDGPFLWCRLPSGRALCYPFPKLVAMAWVEMLDGTATTMSVEVLERASRVVGGLAALGVAKVKGEARPSLTFKFWEKGGWKTGHYYGGHGAENCLAGDTEVLTDSGWKPITEVSVTDKVGDGIECVSHSGLVYRGIQRIGELRGVKITPDHLVLEGDCWTPAQDVLGYHLLDRIADVYDLLNAGPRSRFTVRPAGGGEPFIVHNCTQAACRDLLSEALLRLEDRGYPVVLHVHDEAGAEVPLGKHSLVDFEAIMAEVPEWAPGFPIAAEGYRATRYHK